MGRQFMSGQYCVDADVLLTAWGKTYPLANFPSLWQQLAEHHRDMVFIRPVFDEIDPIMAYNRKKLTIDQQRVNHPLRVWLEEHGFAPAAVDTKVQYLSLALEAKYQTEEHSKGADRSDITLIAYAKQSEKIVVTLESNQPTPPQEKRNYKIPLICALEEVRCMDFMAMLKALRIKV